MTVKFIYTSKFLKMHGLPIKYKSVSKKKIFGGDRSKEGICKGVGRILWFISVILLLNKKKNC